MNQKKHFNPENCLRMKKLLALITLFTLSFQACKKDSAPKDNTPFISFKVDGKRFTYTGYEDTSGNSISGIKIVNRQTPDEHGSHKTIYIQVLQPGIQALSIGIPGETVKPSVITLPTQDHPSDQTLIIIDKGSIYTAGNPGSTVNFEISSIDNNTMTGSFSGTIFEHVEMIDSSGKKTVEITPHSLTEGKFGNLDIPK